MSDDDPARPPIARRVLLVTATVLVPILVGALATVVLYATRAQPVAAQHPNATTDTEIRDGQLLIIQPRNAQQIKVPIGQILEVTLHSGDGQDVVSDNVTTLAPILTPPCHVFSICGVPGAETWAFQAVNLGVVHLRITFGVVACPPADLCPQTRQSPMSLSKPVAILARPRNS